MLDDRCERFLLALVPLAAPAADLPPWLKRPETAETGAAVRRSPRQPALRRAAGTWDTTRRRGGRPGAGYR